MTESEKVFILSELTVILNAQDDSDFQTTVDAIVNYLNTTEHQYNDPKSECNDQ